MLRGQPPKTFLIRFSSSKIGNYAGSYVDNKGKVKGMKKSLHNRT